MIDDPDAALPDLYGELRALAGAQVYGRGATLQPTALVHEVYLRLARRADAFADREHFLAVAARAMRQILIDRARARRTARRGGDRERVDLDGLEIGVTDCDLVALDDLLRQLEAVNPRHARLVELRALAGCTVPEAAAALGVSPRTVNTDWRFVRAWLADALRG